MSIGQMRAMRLQIQAIFAGDPAAWERLIDFIGRIALNLAVALLILLLTLWLSRWASRVTARAIGRMNRRYASDATLPTFISSLVRWIVIVIGLVMILERLGVRTTSILALLGAGSLAIGLALQGALSNVAAGVMLLILRPYRIGDFVEVNGRRGTVKGLDLFVTQLSDPDNLVVFMPNSKVFGEMIVNYSQPGQRRMELDFHVDYADDLDQALALLLDCARADVRIAAKPEPWSKVTALTDNAVTVTLRAWAKTDDYWDVRYDLIKRVKERFETEGLSFPYPHQVSVTKTIKGSASEGETSGHNYPV